MGYLLTTSERVLSSCCSPACSAAVQACVMVAFNSLLALTPILAESWICQDHDGGWMRLKFVRSRARCLIHNTCTRLALPPNASQFRLAVPDLSLHVFRLCMLFSVSRSTVIGGATFPHANSQTSFVCRKMERSGPEVEKCLGSSRRGCGNSMSRIYWPAARPVMPQFRIK